MILPKKHIKLSESLFALGALILEQVDTPKAIDEIWNDLSTKRCNNFDSLVLALDYLFCIGAITIDQKGGIRKCI